MNPLYREWLRQRDVARDEAMLAYARRHNLPIGTGDDNWDAGHEDALDAARRRVDAHFETFKPARTPKGPS